MEQKQKMDNSNSLDVVITTRVRLVRNLADFPFPSKMNKEDSQRIVSLVYDAFNEDQNFRLLRNSDISKNGKQLLKDKSVIKNKKFDAVILNDADEFISCVVNESDHLKIAAFSEGLDCETAMKKVYKIDEFLQKKLQFAASFDFGYLTSRIKDCGTGMKISLRIFIPSIILSGQFDSVISMVKEKKLTLKPLFKSDEIADFSNCIFDLTTANSFEGTEFDQMAIIQSIGELILKTERKIRREFADNNPTVVLNFFKQSFSRAMYSLLLSYEEGVSIISAVKWGLQLGLINGISESELNALYFKICEGHLKYLCDNFAFTFEDDIKKSENLQIKRLRTIVIQQAFEGIVNEKSVS